jgi:hypothetical protein
LSKAALVGVTRAVAFSCSALWSARRNAAVASLCGGEDDHIDDQKTIQSMKVQQLAQDKTGMAKKIQNITQMSDIVTTTLAFAELEFGTGGGVKRQNHVGR